MKLSTRSRYGTRMMVELARHFDGGPLQLGEIARRQNLSVKYLEQIIIPLKKAHYIKSVRGPRGGHMLAKRPAEISVGDIVRTLENESNLTPCLSHPELCDRVAECPTRGVWRQATRALYETLDGITLEALLDSSSRDPGAAQVSG